MAGWAVSYIIYIRFNVHSEMWWKMIQNLTSAHFFRWLGVEKPPPKINGANPGWAGVGPCFCSRSKSPAHWVPKVSKILGTTYSHCDWSPRMLNIFRSRDLRVQVFWGIGVGSRFWGEKKIRERNWWEINMYFELFGSIFSWVCFLSLLNWVYFLSLVDFTDSWSGLVFAISVSPLNNF